MPTSPSLGGNLTMGVAVFSYRGRLAIGVHADADAVPDLDVVVSGLERTLAELAPRRSPWVKKT